MFADIAPTYDFLNHFLSANRDRAWRRRAVELARLRPGERLLDACTGTGDLAFEAARRFTDPPGRIVGTDFCPEMVQIAQRKRAQREARSQALRFAVADTMCLPFRDASFDVVTVGFGIRNVADLAGGLRELARVLRPGGRLLILEFTTPQSAWFRRAFNLYFHHVLPRVGRCLSSLRRRKGDDAYRYLPDSVGHFPDAEGLAQILRECGFGAVRYEYLTLGIAAIHSAERSEDGSHGSAPRQ